MAPLEEARELSSARESNGFQASAAATECASGLSQGGLDTTAVWQITSMSLGVGLFAVPYSFQQLGSVQGVLWIIVMGVFANTAVQRLLDAAVAHNVCSYEGLAQVAFGASGKHSMALITLITTFTATLAYLGAARTLLVDVAVAFFFDFDVNRVPDPGVEVLPKTKDVIVLLILAVAVLPRLLSRNMGDNAWISRGGVMAMCTSGIIFVAVCIAFLINPNSAHVQRGPPPLAFEGTIVDSLQFGATLAFSFSMVFAVFPVLEERAAKSTLAAAVESLRSAVQVSILMSCTIYILVALVGIYTFGSRMKQLALSSLPLTFSLIQVVNLLVGTSTALLVAIIAFPVVQSLELLIRSGSGPALAASSPRPSPRLPRRLSELSDRMRLRPWLVVIVGMVVVLVDAFLDTKTAFALTGSLGLAMGAYIMPCLLFLKLQWRQEGSRWKHISSFVVLLFGCVLLFGATPVTVWKMLDGSKGPQPKPLTEAMCQREAVSILLEA